jgi:glycosyltransferase involved in cell wall biosynthesis
MDRFREEYDLPERYVRCVGTHAYKNVEGAIRAFSAVRHQFDLLKLVVTGNRDYLTRDVFQIVRDLGLGGQVIFTGFFPDEDLKYLYQCAELLLFPSFYEGFGLPILEAFACGTPVVTSTSGSLPEIAGQAALLVNPNDAGDIACSVLKVLSKKGLRDRLRQQGLSRAREFSWEKSARETLSVFVKAISGC